MNHATRKARAVAAYRIVRKRPPCLRDIAKE